MKRFMNMLAFIGLCLVAFALLLSKILGLFNVNPSAVSAIQMVGECIAYIVTLVYAFYYIKNKRNVWWWVAYCVSAVVVVLLVILR